MSQTEIHYKANIYGREILNLAQFVLMNCPNTANLAEIKTLIKKYVSPNEIEIEWMETQILIISCMVVMYHISFNQNSCVNSLRESFSI
jgi:hypothetical protein